MVGNYANTDIIWIEGLENHLLKAEIELICEGTDEAEALETLSKMILEGLGDTWRLGLTYQL